ncbi:MAG: DUF488 domain-containing protein [Casimicrobiaceae bacterium]
MQPIARPAGFEWRGRAELLCQFGDDTIAAALTSVRRMITRVFCAGAIARGATALSLPLSFMPTTRALMSAPNIEASPLVCTIGHSNRSIEAFVDLLCRNAIAHVLDVRTVPRSRHNPQFNRDVLPRSLEAMGIAYTHMPGLGGLRHPHVDSPNAGWRNPSFRGYADYMQAEAFEAEVGRVVSFAASQRCALMCAEAVPWRCHRSMIADALLVRGLGVEDIMGPGNRAPRTLTSFAHVEGTRVTYPLPPDLLSAAGA